MNHWLKNLLVFIPVVASHQGANASSWGSATISFCAISLAASAGYFFNDLRDIKEDQKHSQKKLRPLASGELSRSSGVFFGLALFFLSLLIVFTFQKQNLISICLYFFASILYSYLLKKLILIDIITLIGFYLLRIVIGANSIGVHVSIWLYLFAFSFFSSLALLKRHSELNDEYKNTRKAYALTDRKWLEIAGISSAFSIPLILGLYIQLSPEAKLYKNPLALVASSPVIVYWLISGWRRSLNNELKEDLILFAFKEKSSYVCFGIVLITLGIALW